MDAERLTELVAGMQFTTDLRRQFEILAEQAPQLHRRRRLVVIAVAAAAAIALLIAGAALAGAFDSGSAKVPTPPLPAKSAYPSNAAGKTYGAEKPLVGTPDLIAAVASNGRHGYCLRTDIDPPDYPSVTPTTPPELSKAIDDLGLRGRKIPVYKSDGTTQIGVLQLGGPGTGASWVSGDGSRATQIVDDDLNIITTTVAPDGTTTIETEALDGTVTKKTLTGAEAARLEKSPSPSPAASNSPARPPAWLLERMAVLASDAGDAQAVARWELQTRYFLKPIEGANSPTSEYALVESAWLVILHGDFRDGTWRYWVLNPASHNVLSSGASAEPFDTTRIEPLQGPIELGSR